MGLKPSGQTALSYINYTIDGNARNQMCLIDAFAFFVHRPRSGGLFAASPLRSAEVCVRMLVSASVRHKIFGASVFLTMLRSFIQHANNIFRL